MHSNGLPCVLAEAKRLGLHPEMLPNPPRRVADLGIMRQVHWPLIGRCFGDALRTANVIRGQAA